MYKLDCLTVDRENHETFAYGKKLRLTSKEQQILEKLLKNMDHTVTSELLIYTLYGDKEDGGALSNTLKVNIYTLRKKLYKAAGKNFIVTVPWIGYCIVHPSQWYPACMKRKLEEKERKDE